MRKGTLKPISRKQNEKRGKRWRRNAVRHARNRLGERYGLSISTDEYWALVSAVQTGGGETRFYRPTSREAWHLVRIEGQPVIALYDHMSRHIRTFLPLCALSEIGKTLEDVA